MVCSGLAALCFSSPWALTHHMLSVSPHHPGLLPWQGCLQKGESRIDSSRTEYMYFLPLPLIASHRPPTSGTSHPTTLCANQPPHGTPPSDLARAHGRIRERI
jgi:hypothetical protein